MKHIFKLSLLELKIIIDSAIPFLESLFESYAEVEYIAGSKINAAQVRDADALIIRTRTRCDAALLEGSRVSIIATATIGFDHIDMEYCRAKGITVTTAAGCNARAVLQWVGAALSHLSKGDGWQPEQRTIGVVGVGNVGGLVARYCEAWGFKVLRCDPPRALREEGFIPLEQMLPQVDILTLHTPLNESSYHILNSQNIKLLKPSAAIINTSRGECVESGVLLGSESRKIFIDVWEEEPDIDPAILQRATLATYHIAGYSLQGKANGSAMSVESVARHLELPIEGWYPPIERNLGREIGWTEMCRSVGEYFDIEAESRWLKSHREEFESLRNNYSYRNEYF